jgi:hypothetical protein
MLWPVPFNKYGEERETQRERGESLMACV